MRLENKILNSTDSGFTLLELLIAVAIMSVLMIAVYGSFFSVLKSQAGIEDEMEKITEIRRFMDMFSVEIKSSFFKDSNPITQFNGGRKRTSNKSFSDITFAAFTYHMSGENHQAGNLTTVRYFIEETDHGNTGLYKEVWNPYMEKERLKVEIIQHVEDFEVQYFNGKDWVPVWDGLLEKTPPHAVKASVFILERGTVKKYSTTAQTRIR